MRGRLAPGNGAKCVRIRERTPVFISFLARFLSIFERFLCYLHGFSTGFARFFSLFGPLFTDFYGAFTGLFRVTGLLLYASTRTGEPTRRGISTRTAAPSFLLLLGIC